MNIAMKRPMLLLLLTALVLPCVAEQPVHPFRKVGDRYYDLRPIYKWLALTKVPMNKLTPKELASPRPMTEWVGAATSLNTSFSTRYRVQQVLEDGLLVTVTHSTTGLGSSTESMFLTNFPGASNVHDGQMIEFLALKTGLYKHGSQTIELFDYGTPYNPFAKQPQAKPAEPKKKSPDSTNAPAGNQQQGGSKAS
jgi:hypothetical protein